MNAFRHPISGRAQGFSLIEVLIALVILSVGLLGIAAMVSVSMKSKNGSYLRTQALALSSAILDRMRANHDTAVSNNYDGSTAPTSPTSCNGTLAGGVNCTPAQIAQMDLYEWHTELLNLLGSDATYSITTQGVTQEYNKVTVTISWNDSPTNGTLNGSSGCSAAAGVTTLAATVTATGNTGCYNSIVITSGI